MKRIMVGHCGALMACGILLALLGSVAAVAEEAGQVPASQSTAPAADRVVSMTSDDRQFQQGVAAYDAEDYKAAYDFWLPLAWRGNLSAQRNVGHLLRLGLGVERDFRKALKFYREAADAGLVGAQANVAMMHLDGLGTRQSDKKAVHWFAKAAKAGHVVAQFELAKLVEEGRGTPRDINLAVKLYGWAADAGHKGAAARLADITQAPEERAEIRASSGTPAQNSGVAHKTIPGPAEAYSPKLLLSMPPTHAATLRAANRAFLNGKRPVAVEFWRDLAREKVPEAQFRAGLATYLGLGTSKDNEAAIRYLTKAQENGHPAAARVLVIMEADGDETDQAILARSDVPR